MENKYLKKYKISSWILIIFQYVVLAFLLYLFIMLLFIKSIILFVLYTALFFIILKIGIDNTKALIKLIGFDKHYQAIKELKADSLMYIGAIFFMLLSLIYEQELTTIIIILLIISIISVIIINYLMAHHNFNKENDKKSEYLQIIDTEK